ncbi:MAG: ABC transporter substrate-binding protein [Proteobacteria bacterium]|nr:ABC transporter substrate-binding protein [Pseudomonadota bacterium]
MRKAVVLLLCFSVLLGTSTRTALAQARLETVKLAVLAPSALLWLHAIAEDHKFYAARGITVEVLQTASSPVLLQAVSTGSVDAGVSLGDVVIRAIDQGAPVIITGAVLGHTILRLMGAPGIQTAAELAGKPVTAGAVEGGTANLLRYQLKNLKVDPRGVQMVSIANSRDRLVALKAGQVQGALMLAPFDTLGERENMKILDVYKLPYVQTPLIVNTAWAQKNRKAAVAITLALRDAAEWINNAANRTEAGRILATYTKGAADVADASYQFVVVDQKAIPRDLMVTAAGLQNIMAIDDAIAAGPAPRKPFELNRYFDRSFLDGK